MQSLYSTAPEKIIIGMVGCTHSVIQCRQEASPTLVRRYIGTSIGWASTPRCSTSATIDANT